MAANAIPAVLFLVDDALRSLLPKLLSLSPYELQLVLGEYRDRIVHVINPPVASL